MHKAFSVVPNMLLIVLSEASHRIRDSQLRSFHAETAFSLIEVADHGIGVRQVHQVFDEVAFAVGSP